MNTETENEVHTGSLRQQASEAAKRHKASWLLLGQYLQTIHKEKLYKKWGFLAFETYCTKELRIKETTAAKLVRSYSFLEREEPGLVRPVRTAEGEGPAENLPHYESVNLLRLAKTNDKFTPHDIAAIRGAVLTKGLEPTEVRVEMKKILERKEPEKPPAEVLNARRSAAIRRLLTVLTSVKNELVNARLAPAYLIRQMEDLAGKLEDQLS